MRLERDSVGTLEVPQEAYYGVQSLRAKRNFPITGQSLRPEMIVSLAQIKKASAITNFKAGVLDEKRYQAIVQACDEIIQGKWQDQFICDPIQGGAGTSANMNANEVIANRAGEILGGEKGAYDQVHPNDHVNEGQSTNDVYPTSGKLTALKLMDQMLPELESLHEALEAKAAEFDDIIKVGRTQLQDAVPMRLGQSFAAFASAISRDISRLKEIKKTLYVTNMGGTAIGTGINACGYYMDHISEELANVTGYPMVTADNLFDATQNLDVFVALSGMLKAAAVNLSKMSNDLRLLSSGPRTGMEEINLPARQNGSSIMPGKVNPVIPEVVSQVAFNIIGNDMCITMAAEAGQLELNAFEPVLFYNLFESIETLGRAAKTLRENCIVGITANRGHLKDMLNRSLAMVTALCPYIGYTKAADLAHESLESDVPIRDLLKRDFDFTNEKLDEIMNPDSLTRRSNE